MAGAPSRTQILRLYRDYMSTAQSFSSYNFRTYFQRRSRDMFRSTLLPAASVPTPAPSSVTDQASLATWYAAAKRDLATLRRAALTNQMYAGEKLVVEKPKLVTRGGGAGAEASVGGAGQ